MCRCRYLAAALAALIYGASVGAQDVETIPADAELEQQGAVVGEIEIVVVDVFDTSLPEENRRLFRLANRLHIATRQDVIRRQLLLRPGEPYLTRLKRESERILRTNRYLRDAEIKPVRHRDGAVDVQVRVYDVWTIKAGFNFGRSGGRNTTGFEVQDSNLLGYGKELTLMRRSDVDRTASEVRYFDPHVLGDWTQFLGDYSSNSDGRLRFARLNRPFYSLDTHWAASGSALDWDRTEQRYALGQAVDEFRQEEKKVEIGGGWSPGWRNGWVHRVGWGGAYEQQRFEPTLSLISATTLPPDRKLAYPFLSYTFLEDNFEERRNQNQIERTEDMYTGAFVSARIGWAAPAVGADRTAWLWSVTAGDSLESDERKHTLLLRTDVSGRQEYGRTDNFIANARIEYYWRTAERQLFFAGLRGTATSRLDPERQIMLGGDVGLRGYPLRYQEGSREALFTLEHRVYTNIYLFRLFHLGGAVFFDAGKAWGASNSNLSNAPQLASPYLRQGILKDVGLGLRFGSSRSAFGNVIHVDLAFPLDGDPSIKRTQFIVETKASF